MTDHGKHGSLQVFGSDVTVLTAVDTVPRIKI